TILSISGKPGLYKLISQGKNMLIVESVSADKKRFPVYDHEKVISLADIAMYTYESEVPLTEVFKSIQKKEEGKAIELDVKKASADQLRDFLGEVLTDFYRERVYPSDIKKLITWYNLLLTNGITDFEEVKKEEAEEATAGEGETAEEK
ncbi:MAG: DUF5606 domain-containing protein, partial [Bacteroides sp.]|nr:DUF5606 domain-containing protein [Bacteroides sp.]